MALVVLAPVSVVARAVGIPSQIETLYGSIWQGRAGLAGGYALTWQTTPGALIAGRIDARFLLQGADTQVAGTLRVGLRSVEMRDLTGRAGPGLLALVNGMPQMACTARGVVDIARLATMRGAFAAEGTVAIEAGACTEANGRITRVPDMLLTLLTQGDDAVARLTQSDTHLLNATVRGTRRLALRIEPDGARLVPGLPTGGPIELDFPF